MSRAKAIWVVLLVVNLPLYSYFDWNAWERWGHYTYPYPMWFAFGLAATLLYETVCFVKKLKPKNIITVAILLASGAAIAGCGFSILVIHDYYFLIPVYFVFLGLLVTGVFLFIIPP